jgi:hypothetical protein
MFTTSVYFIFEVYGRALTIVGLGSEDLVLDKRLFFSFIRLFMTLHGFASTYKQCIQKNSRKRSVLEKNG